jgi:signal transduction histidine kinase/ActR/RegA family two-component response regulator
MKMPVPNDTSEGLEQLPGFVVNPVTLSFPDSKLEKKFLCYYGKSNLSYWRLCHVLGAFFFCTYTIIQSLAIPLHRQLFLSFGFGIALPMFLLGYVLTYRKFYQRHWQMANIGYLVVTGVLALGMASFGGKSYLFFTLSGVMFCYLFGYAIIRLRFFYASIIGGGLTAVFFIYGQALLGSEGNFFGLGAFYMLGFNFLGMLIAYGMEVYARRDFLSCFLLNQEKDKVAETNESLETRVAQRTRELAEKNLSLEEEVKRNWQLENERSELEHKFLQAQKMESVGRLAGEIAHDFNNLLTVINSYAELVATDLPEGDPRLADVMQISEAGSRAATLTRQLLAFSKKQVLDTRIIGLNELVSGMEKMLRRLVGEDIDFYVNLADDCSRVYADQGLIEQVLMNLVVNARDAMPNGGKLSVETANVYLDEDYAKCHPDTNSGPYVMLAIIDNGEGILTGAREQIFEPFFTTKEKVEGSGLGLATAYGIVKQSGGNIWVYREVELGTTFKIYLPALEAADVPEVVMDDSSDLRGSETVLIVEDEESVLRLAERILNSAGYASVTAANGNEAIKLLGAHQGKIDLVLTDIIMPEMGGRELGLRLPTICSEVKTLYMSGYSSKAIVRQGVIDEQAHFLAKPFTAHDLLRKVKMVLNSDKS